MQRDLSEEAQRWISQAREDMRAAEALAELEIHHAACFHAQQAAEKALKGGLLCLNREPVRTHSVVVLCGLLEELRPELSELRPEIGFLDQFYGPTRYPDALPGGIPAEVFGAAESDRALAGGKRAIEVVAQLQDLHRSGDEGVEGEQEPSSPNKDSAEAPRSADNNQPEGPGER